MLWPRRALKKNVYILSMTLRTRTLTDKRSTKSIKNRFTVFRYYQYSSGEVFDKSMYI